HSRCSSRRSRHACTPRALGKTPSLSHPPQRGEVDAETCGGHVEARRVRQDPLDVSTLDVVERVWLRRDGERRARLSRPTSPGHPPAPLPCARRRPDQSFHSPSLAYTSSSAWSRRQSDETRRTDRSIAASDQLLASVGLMPTRASPNACSVNAGVPCGAAEMWSEYSG